jgi:hypothetical protein
MQTNNSEAQQKQNTMLRTNVAGAVYGVGLWDQFEHKLNQSEKTTATTCYDTSTTCYPIQPTPWLEVTQWVGFLQGHDLAKAA